MSNNKKNTIAGQWDEYIAPFLQSLRVPQKGEPGYIPVTTSAQDIEKIEKARKQSMMDSMQSQKAPELPIEQPKMNPVVENYIKSKINKAPVSIPKSENEEIQAPLVRKPDYMDKFNDEAYANAKQDSESRQDGLGWLQFAAGFGDALAQRSPMESANKFENIRARIKDETVGQFNRDKNQAVDDFKNKKMMDTFNPDSEQSIAFKKMIEAKFPDVARSYGKMWNQVSAADKDNIFEPLKLKENIEARKEYSRIANENRQDSKDARTLERQRERMTNYGEARTIEDAKQLKNASEMKDKFDRQLDELLELRKKHGGGALLNRDDVGRAKQLSKDLLLTYKDMSKLGVLSQSDNEILNAIIPPDPLAYDFVPGQDPILHKMEKFKGDTQADFDTRLSNRLLNPVQKPQSNPMDSKIDSFMKKNGIADRNEAIRILKENGKI